MYIKRITSLTGLIGVMTMTTANAVLPAVATDNTVMDNTVAVPLIPQIVPSVSQPIQVQPVAIQTPPLQHQTIQPITSPTFISQNQNQIQTKLTASIIAVNPQGGEMLAPITSQVKLPKGSVIEYHGYIINNTPERVKTLKATFDIPARTELQSITNISPQPAYGSNDSMRFNYLPIKSSINGILQEVPMSYYKALQWDIAGLGLNEVAEVKYRVVVK